MNNKFYKSSKKGFNKKNFDILNSKIKDKFSSNIINGLFDGKIQLIIVLLLHF